MFKLNKKILLCVILLSIFFINKSTQAQVTSLNPSADFGSTPTTEPPPSPSTISFPSTTSPPSVPPPSPGFGIINISPPLPSTIPQGLTPKPSSVPEAAPLPSINPQGAVPGGLIPQPAVAPFTSTITPDAATQTPHTTHNEEIPSSIPTESFNKNIDLQPTTSFTIPNFNVNSIIPLESDNLNFAFTGTDLISNESSISFVQKTNGTLQTTDTQRINNVTSNPIVSDVNNDGKPEIILENDVISVNSEVINQDFNSNILAVGDFNNDEALDYVFSKAGFLDIIPGTPDNPTTITSNVNFRERNSLQQTPYIGNSNLYVADFNGDGNDDILSSGTGKSKGKNYFSIFYGNGNLGFTTESIQTNSKLTSFALADVDGDKDIDIVGGSNKKVVVLLNNNEGNSFNTNEYNTTNATGVEVGDVNQDGELDIITYTKDLQGFAVLTGKNDGTFDTPKYISTGPIKSLSIQDSNVIVATPILGKSKSGLNKQIKGTNITIFSSSPPLEND